MISQTSRIFIFCGLMTASLVSYALYNQAISQIVPPKDLKTLQWQMHDSVTGSYKVKFPEKYKFNLFPFMFNNETIAWGGEILSSIDEKPPTVDRNISVRSMQTFGTDISVQKAKDILRKDSIRYKLIAENIKGYLVSDEDIKVNGYPGKKLFISYTLGEEKYGIRISVYVTNYSKVEQVVTGPASSMYSYRADDFFDSVELFDGRGKVEPGSERLGSGWVKYRSKHNFFTAKLPPQNQFYAPDKPKFKLGKQKETMSFHITDPIYNEKVFLNVSAYKFDNKMSPSDVKALLFSEHISKYVSNIDTGSVNIENDRKGDVNTMKSKLVISPLKSVPYINTIFLEVRYFGNYVLVSEFLAGPRHSKSKLANTLFSLIDFHPRQFKPFMSKKQRALIEKRQKAMEAGEASSSDESDEEEEIEGEVEN